MSSSSHLVALCALASALCVAVGARLAWAVPGGCSGTVVSLPLQPGKYNLTCAGNCEPQHPNPCKPAGVSGQGSSGAVSCVCGDSSGPGLEFPPNGPCIMFLSWRTIESGKVYSVSCSTNDGPAPPPRCTPEGDGIVVDPLTGDLSGEGSVTCPCP